MQALASEGERVISQGLLSHLHSPCSPTSPLRPSSLTPMLPKFTNTAPPLGPKSYNRYPPEATIPKALLGAQILGFAACTLHAHTHVCANKQGGEAGDGGLVPGK